MSVLGSPHSPAPNIAYAAVRGSRTAQNSTQPIYLSVDVPPPVQQYHRRHPNGRSSKWTRFCGTVRPNDDQTNEKGTATMKLTVNMNVSVDGVMQGLGGSDEDRSGGFERSGWAMPHFDEETAALTGEVYQRADAFLFGRRTYEVFAGSWGTGSWGANEGDNPISVALNTRPKYVASTTLTDPQWADTTVLSGDVAAAVGELKAKPGGELQVVGSLSLVRWLLDNDLVDRKST